MDYYVIGEDNSEGVWCHWSGTIESLKRYIASLMLTAEDIEDEVTEAIDKSYGDITVLGITYTATEYIKQFDDGVLCKYWNGRKTYADLKREYYYDKRKDEIAETISNAKIGIPITIKAHPQNLLLCAWHENTVFSRNVFDPFK